MKMENKNALDHIRNFKIEPSASSWITVKEKLKRNRAKRKINLYRNLAIAASIIAIITITISYTSTFPIQEGNTFATNHLYQPILLEDLPIIKDDPFYAYDKIIQMVPKKDLEENAHTKANVGEQISIKN